MIIYKTSIFNSAIIVNSDELTELNFSESEEKVCDNMMSVGRFTYLKACLSVNARFCNCTCTCTDWRTHSGLHSQWARSGQSHGELQRPMRAVSSGSFISAAAAAAGALTVNMTFLTSGLQAQITWLKADIASRSEAIYSHQRTWIVRGCRFRQLHHNLLLPASTWMWRQPCTDLPQPATDDHHLFISDPCNYEAAHLFWFIYCLCRLWLFMCWVVSRTEQQI